MSLADCKVIGIVAGRDFQRTGAKRHIHVGVVDDRNGAFEHGHEACAADQVTVTLVVRMHGYGGVAQDGLGTRGCHRDVTLAWTVLEIRACNGVFEVVECGVLFAVLHLQVADGRLQAGRPVDEVLPAVDQPHAIEAHECFAHCATQPIVHREPDAIPVARRAEPAELTHDVTTVLLLPLPGAAEEFLPAKVLPPDTLSGKHLFDLELRGNSCMVVPWNPQRCVAPHALVADHQVLQRHEHRVAKVQLTRDVGWRNRDHERLRVRSGDFRLEEA